MAEPSPAATPPGQEPESVEGQEPNPEAAQEGQEGQGRSYTEAYVKQLRREASGYRTRLSEAEERLQELEDADKSEQERLTERFTAAERRAVEAETKLLRYEVAAERGLDLKAAAFLGGSTREEIELRAEELEQLLDATGQTQTPAGFDGGARQPAPEQKDPETAHNELILRSLGRRA